MGECEVDMCEGDDCDILFCCILCSLTLATTAADRADRADRADKATSTPRKRKRENMLRCKRPLLPIRRS